MSGPSCHGIASAHCRGMGSFAPDIDSSPAGQQLILPAVFGTLSPANNDKTAPAKRELPEAWPSRTVTNLAAGTVPDKLRRVLDSPEIRELEALRWTGRRGYPARALVGACLVKSLYGMPTWRHTAALIGEHAGLREVLGAAPSHWALYRFAGKLRKHRVMLEACIGRVLSRLRECHPGLGVDVAIDSADLPAYANG